MALSSQVNDDDFIVPGLRQDLQIIDGWPLHTGAPTWMLFDPLRNRYFRINQSHFYLLSAWKAGYVSQIKHAAEECSNRYISEAEVGNLIKFLFANQLTNIPPEQGYHSYLDGEKKGQRSWLGNIVHGYLFFRIPLFRPQKFLEITWPFVKPLFTRFVSILFVVIAIIGLYLVSRQWDVFAGQFINFLSIEGFLFYGTSLVFVKTIHELGHAYMAVRYGLKVPVIGVAFLVLMPILYTDTSNAWRLRNRKDRLMVDGAGIMSELCLAALATIAWVFLSDGPARSVAFSIATVSWTLSILVNLNPFMRFDGYYILSDLLGFENLQQRGFELARWKMREIMFGLGNPPPERVSTSLGRTLILHAWGTWVYRFFLFIGIAILVYTFFIKVLALFLFAVEIIWFIFLPIYRELKMWWLMRRDILAKKRSWITGGVWLGGVILLLLPLSGTVKAPAILHVADTIQVFPPMSANLKNLHIQAGAKVRKGDVLAEFTSDDLLVKHTVVKSKIALTQRRLDRGNADKEDGTKRIVFSSELSGLQDELAILDKKIDELVLRAGISGLVVDVNRELHAGRTFQHKDLLFRIQGQGAASLSGVVAEQDVHRIQTGAQAVFIPDNFQQKSTAFELTGVNKTSVSRLPFPELAEVYGGGVPASKIPGAGVTADGSFYSIYLKRNDAIPFRSIEQTQRGVVHVEAKRMSIATRVFQRVGSVLIREMGF